jgi:hypothetical protein
MPRAKSSISNFGSGNTKLRAVVTTAAAALIGTLVGGASVLGIVTAVTQPPAHDIKPMRNRAPAPPRLRLRGNLRLRGKRQRCRHRKPRQLLRSAKVLLRPRDFARSGLTRSRRAPIMGPSPQPQRQRRSKLCRPRMTGPL